MKIFKSLVILSLSLSTLVVAQDYNLKDKLPIDKDVRVGKLPNGLTYYIRKNSLPKDRVELRLALNAGSILEDEDQRGLAHFTEHMAFNGTKHFEKNELISYLQSVGIKFGTDLNAYTSFDETVYRLLVPTDKAEVVDKAFLVLEDWAHNISFNPKEIESERGVITEEWRIGRGANQRLQDKYFPVVFNQSQYAQRLPIGKKEVIQGFKPESILRFYKEWYRPDLLAVIVVGDVDVDQYEQKIKAHFGAIANPANERPRKIFDVPNHAFTLFSINTDKEATQTQIQVYSKTAHKDEGTLGDYRNFIIEQLYYFILNQRFGDLSRSSEPPFVFAKSSFQAISRSKDAFTVSLRVRENGVEKGLKTVLEELERVKRFGFTEGELERAKKSITLKYDRAYNERDKSESDGYASELIRHFLANEAIPGISFEHEFTKFQLPTIKLNEINNFDNEFLSDSNRVVVVTGLEKDGVTLPTVESLQKIVDDAPKASLEPYRDKASVFAWPGKKPTAGTIVKEDKNAALNLTTLTLSNGVKVLLKPTDFKNNEIHAVAYSKGGVNFYSDTDYFSALYASVLVGESGIANLSKSDLIKAFTGKEVTLTPFLNSVSEGISGRTSPKDLEVFFQLTNLYFTQPRIDSVVSATFVTKTKSTLLTLKLNPQKYFEDQVSRILSNNNPRGGGFPEPTDLDKINYKRSLEIFKQRFANAGDFSFVFVGSFDLEKIKPLIQTYIASLPATKERETSKDLGIRPPKGLVEKTIVKGADAKSGVNLSFTGLTKYNEQESYVLQSLNDVLTIKLMESLREKKSGVYGVRSNGHISKYPYENYTEQISFQCAPENVDSLIKAALIEIDKIKKNGVEAKDLEKVKETQKRKLEVDLKSNAFWLNELASVVVFNNKVETEAGYLKQIDELTSAQLQKVAKKYFGTNLARLVLNPEEEKR